MLTKIPAKAIKKGMFVAQLDRPWLESPFMLQGFLVETEEEIDQLAGFSSFVYIDPEMSALEEDSEFVKPAKADVEIEMAEITFKAVEKAAPVEVSKAEQAKEELDERGKVVNLISDEDELEIEKKRARLKAAEPVKKVHDSLGIPSSFILYTEETSVEEEMQVAEQVHQELTEVINSSIERIEQDGQVDLEKVQESTEALVESMIRNPDAAHLLSQLKQNDSYSYAHSIEAAVLGVLFGRHLGLTKRELDDLALGILLLDIGKTKLPRKLLEKNGRLNPTEVKLMKLHVKMGVDILKKNTSVSRDVLDIAMNHHERFDGKGYPLGKEGQQISVFARMAAIIDFYDAVTHKRPWRNAIKPAAAINALYDRRDKNFQAELVEEFIQCLGLYPTGSVVELSSGEVGIVIEQNRIRRLRPKVLIVRDELKEEVEVPFTRDLDKDRVDHTGKPLMIKTGLQSDAYGISREDYYL